MDKKTEDLYFNSHNEDEKTQDLNYYQTKSDITTDALFYSEKTPEPVERKAKRRCMGCMELIGENDEYCENCGYLNNDESTQPLNIKPGTIIGDKYIVGKSIGSGGFGVTYIGWDTVLERKVAIKEYLPSEFATRCYGQTQVTVFSGEKADQFAIGRQKFVEEAKRLAKFKSENGIVKIYDSFEENETAYIVMEYLDGETLAKFIQREGKVSPEKAVEMMMPVIEALEAVNEAGIIHRDIAPDNILLTKTGEIKLIDFGAARYATTTHSKSLTVIIKPGYSAEEQYRSRGEQGPHTDVYSVGAVLYKLITGETPPDALERRATFQSKGKDILKPIHKIVKNVPPNIETAIHNAMNVRIEDRTPDMINLAGELLSEEPVKRRDGKISKIDVLTWPLWAKIGVPSGFVVAVTLCLLLAFGVIGPRSRLQTGVEIPDGMTLVPDVITYELNEAEKELNKKDLKLVIGDKKNNEKIKENLVLMQNPDAGNIVGMGSFINVTISAGAAKEYVIDVKDYTLELAKKELEALGFKVEIKEEYNSDVAPGAVISQSAKAGDAVAKGSVITLVISKGDKGIDTSKTVAIPNVVGTNIEKAKEEVKKLKLYVAISEIIYDEKLPEGQITKQSPEGNSSGHQGDTIKVTVNKGAKKVYMLDVTYRTEAEAIEMLKSHGITVNIVREENRGVAAGTVFKQSVAAGTEIKAGTTVTLTVSKGFEVTVPNVVGQAKGEAQKNLMSAGLASTVTYQSSASVPKDHVISQSVKAGEKVNQGTTVNLVVSTGTEAPPAQKYAVTVTKGSGISSVTGAGSYEAGATVTVKATVSSGYKFSKWTSSNTKLLGDSASISYTFKMPASNVTLTANAFKIGKVIASGTNGKDIKWKAYDNGVLDIYGTGEMVGYDDPFDETISRPSWGYGDNLNNLMIKKIYISEGITSICYGAFSVFHMLEEVIIPDSVKIIDNYAFNSCENLRNIYISQNVTKIGDGAFSYCNKLKSINVSPNNKNYTVINGVLFSKDKTKLVAYPSGKGNETYNIPNGVQTICPAAFYGSDVINVTIPSSVTIIGKRAFAMCYNLKNVTIAEGLKKLEEHAFMNCRNLEEVKLPNSLRTIEWAAFAHCERLVNITIPQNVTSIGVYAFSDCISLTSVTIPKTVESIDYYAFFNWTANQTIYIKGKSSAPAGWDKDWDAYCNAKIVWNA